MDPKKVAERLDHPVLFAVAVTFVVIPLAAMLTVGFKKLGMPGPASLVQHP